MKKAALQNLLTSEDLAKRWGMELGSVENWRQDKKGPPYIKIGKLVRYRVEDVIEFENRHTVKAKHGRR